MTIVEPKRASDVDGLHRPVFDVAKELICCCPTALNGLGCMHQHLHAVLAVAPSVLYSSAYKSVNLKHITYNTVLLNDRSVLLLNGSVRCNVRVCQQRKGHASKSVAASMTLIHLSKIHHNHTSSYGVAMDIQPWLGRQL